MKDNNEVAGQVKSPTAEDIEETKKSLAEAKQRIAEHEAKLAAEEAKLPCAKCGGDRRHPAVDSGMPSGVCPKDC